MKTVSVSLNRNGPQITEFLISDFRFAIEERLNRKSAIQNQKFHVSEGSAGYS
jgi:hypothetical protein